LIRESQIPPPESDAIDPEQVGDPHQPGWPPGHFYSPVPLISEIRKREAELFGVPPEVQGIDLHIPEQLELFDELKRYYGQQPFGAEKTDGLAYYFDNGFFSYADAITLHTMIRHLAPRRIVEVGSGFSSCVTVDTNRLFFGNAIQCTFIEPYPDVINTLLPESDRKGVAIIRQKVQKVDLEIFRQLQAGDILFIDSTHVSKIGSDVNRLILDVLPILDVGVFIHFHDIFYPFEYPKSWIYEGRAWNEAYVLRAFLQFNSQFQIVYFLDYLERFHKPKFELEMPLCLKNTGASFWIKKSSPGSG
jgi:hypothetical protein